MKRFVSVFLLLGGLLVAGGANAAFLGTALTTDCTNFTPSSFVGQPGDQFQMRVDRNGNPAGITCSNYASSNNAVITLNGSFIDDFILSSTVITVTFQGYGLATVNGSGNPVIQVSPPAPTVTSVSPTSGSAGGGLTITLTGTSLTGASSITVGGNACTTFNVSSATSATCVTPAGNVGPASIVVTTSGGSNTPNTLFTYTPAPAAVPTLSEWAQLMLALMVIGIAWHFHNNRQNSY